MIFTYEQFEKLKSDAFEYAKTHHPTLRKGQALYNYFYHRLEHLEPTIITLDNKDIDCFYRDDKIDLFLNSLQNEIVNTNDYN